MAKFALRAALVCSILMYTQAWQVPQIRSRLLSKSVVNPVSLNSLKKSPFSSPTENYLGSLRMSSSDDSEQKGLKALIPTKTERKKLLPLAGMLFCILFNYTILRDTKDVLVVTAPGSGAEIIPFLKTYVNLPISILLTIVYSQLTNVMSAANVFYTILGSFLGFFAAFPTLIYPFRDTLHPNALCDFLMEKLPIVFYPFISMLRNWTYAIFYTMAQIWGSMVLSLLFWGFSNEVTSVPEAKKYYPLFGLLANVALIFSGQYVRFVSDIRSKLPDGVDAWGVSLNYLMGAVVAMGGVIAGLYNHMQKNVLTDPECVPELRAKKKKEKVSMSLGESAKYLAGSPYIRYLAMLVIGYGMSINIVEVTWKGKLKEAFPDPNAYAAFMGNFSTATGTVTLVMMILGRFILEKFGWGVAALITPLTLAATGAGFFTLILGGDKFLPFFEKLGTTPLMAACIIGAAQNIASKSTKYSLFDPSKEMAYIPLDQEQKTKGKAAIDVIGNPLGKSGGSFIQQVLIATFGSLAASTPYLGAILFVVTGGWIFSAGKLAPLFEEAMKKKEAEDAAAAEA
mmetsp:Transcript_25237/g.40984  ORF Transcript_25237/g.40984 Transcript_25237/m.40984 type:complete len:568 (+) Transcript_25237:76-1779(+)